MPETLEATGELLDYLVALRKEAVKSTIGREGSGILGVLLANKERVISGCVFCSVSHCYPAPQTSRQELNKAIALGYKKNMIPVGIIVLNPDEGCAGSFVGGGNMIGRRYDGKYDSKSEIKYARTYTLYRLASLLNSFSLSPYLVIVDNENTPVYLKISPQEIKEIYRSHEQRSTSYSATFVEAFQKIQASQSKYNTECLAVGSSAVSRLLSRIMAEKQEGGDVK